MSNPNRMFLYGTGVFTTVPIENGVPLLWQKHWERLNSYAHSVGVDLADYEESSVQVALDCAIQNLSCGRVRLTFVDNRPGELWWLETPDEQKTALSILIDEKRPVPEAFTLTTSPFPVNSRSPLAGVKSCNYLEQILSLDEAKGRGFHEAVRVNERGHVTSGCMSNIFWLKNGRLYTPTLATGCLAGTTREYVLENIACEEVEAEIGELESAEAIYLTSAGLGIVRVAEFDGRELSDTKHPIQHLWPPRT